MHAGPNKSGQTHQNLFLKICRQAIQCFRHIYMTLKKKNIIVIILHIKIKGKLFNTGLLQHKLFASSSIAYGKLLPLMADLANKVRRLESDRCYYFAPGANNLFRPSGLPPRPADIAWPSIPARGAHTNDTIHEHQQQRWRRTFLMPAKSWESPKFSASLS